MKKTTGVKARPLYDQFLVLLKKSPDTPKALREGVTERRFREFFERTDAAESDRARLIFTLYLMERAASEAAAKKPDLEEERGMKTIMNVVSKGMVTASVRLPIEIKAELDRMAKEDARTFSSLATKIFLKAIADNDYEREQKRRK